MTQMMTRTLGGATRRSALAGLALATLSLATMALTTPSFGDDGNAPQPFTEAAFDAAQKAGKPILIDTYATWCDICARQKPIIDKLLAEPRYRSVVAFRVNFDTQKAVMRQFNARLQSTLIAFHGTKETGRSVGDTQPEWIDDLMSKTLDGSTS